MKSEATLCLAGTSHALGREGAPKPDGNQRQISAEALAGSGGTGEVMPRGHLCPSCCRTWMGAEILIPSPGTAGLSSGSVVCGSGLETPGVCLALPRVLHRNINGVISGTKIKSGQAGNINRFYKTL